MRTETRLPFVFVDDGQESRVGKSSDGMRGNFRRLSD